MVWYNNPTIAAILGAIVGAFITGGVSLFIWQKTSKIKRVDCIINDVSSLLSFSDSIRNKLEVIYSGERASSVFLFNLEIINSGTTAIGCQPIKIRLSKNAKIVDYTIKTFPKVGFGKIDKKKLSEYGIDLEIELLNPQDRVLIEIISINNSSGQVDVYMKNANVISRVFTQRTAENDILRALSQQVDPSLASLAVMSSLPFFGGFARSLMTVVLAQRLETIVRSKK